MYAFKRSRDTGIMSICVKAKSSLYNNILAFTQMDLSQCAKAVGQTSAAADPRTAVCGPTATNVSPMTFCALGTVFGFHRAGVLSFVLLVDRYWQGPYSWSQLQEDYQLVAEVNEKENISMEESFSWEMGRVFGPLQICVCVTRLIGYESVQVKGGVLMRVCVNCFTVTATVAEVGMCFSPSYMQSPVLVAVCTVG